MLNALPDTPIIGWGLLLILYLIGAATYVAARKGNRQFDQKGRKWRYKTFSSSIFLAPFSIAEGYFIRVHNSTLREATVAAGLIIMFYICFCGINSVNSFRD